MNQVSAVFHSLVICRSVSPKFVELCMEPCLCPSGGGEHKHGGRKLKSRKITEASYLSLSFALETKKLLL